MKRTMACLLCIMLMLFAVPAFCEEGCPVYDVILPERYEQTEDLYPVVYVLPDDGLSGDGVLQVDATRPDPNDPDKIHRVFAVKAAFS